MGLSGSAGCRKYDCRRRIVRVVRLGIGAVAERDNKN